MSSLKPKAVIVTGATASGKTAWVHALASPSDILINADSRQIYRGLDIGTAKPSHSELSRFDYRLIDICLPKETYNAFQFIRDVQKIFAENHSQQKKIWIVGGTPFYLSALLDGLFEAESVSPEIRTQVQDWGKSEGIKGLFTRVSKLDPEYALEVDAKNPRRLTRALEAMIASGEKFSAMRARRAPQFSADYLVIAPFRSRQDLYSRINKRVDEMMDLGFLNEVKKLLEEGVLPQDSGMTSIGYRELTLFLEGKGSLESATSEIKASTRHFAKRQINFLRHLKNVLWVADPEEKASADPLDDWFRDLPELDNRVLLKDKSENASLQSSLNHSQLKEMIGRFYGT